MNRFLTVLLTATLYAPAAIAGSTTGDDYLERTLDFSAAFVCTIFFDVDRETVDNVGTELWNFNGWIDGGTGADEVRITGMTPAMASRTPLPLGGDLYKDASDNIIAVAELNLTFTHNCPNGARLAMTRTATAGANPGATVHYANDHMGTGWETTIYGDVPTGGSSSGPGTNFTDGEEYNLDLAFRFPLTTDQNPGTTSTTITFMVSDNP
jgi:hypothetical protein